MQTDSVLLIGCPFYTRAQTCMTHILLLHDTVLHNIAPSSFCLAYFRSLVRRTSILGLHYDAIE